VRVALSLKRLCPNPWETLVETTFLEMSAGNHHRDQALWRFCRLDEGVEGLVHISSMNLGTDHKTLTTPSGRVRWCG
jgi:small subunit ribosomal protein S1